jgi:hypothetical protein
VGRQAVVGGHSKFGTLGSELPLDNWGTSKHTDPPDVGRARLGHWGRTPIIIIIIIIKYIVFHLPLSSMLIAGRERCFLHSGSNVIR